MHLIKWILVGVVISDYLQLGPISVSSIRAPFVFIFYLIFILYSTDIHIKTPLDYFLGSLNINSQIELMMILLPVILMNAQMYYFV
jgi:hypothetical protein